jgi:2,4-didehydro-3-deoxy-L-rhamnonate hydrolase
VSEFFLATAALDGGTTAALVSDGLVYALPGRPTVRSLLDQWDASLRSLEALAGSGELTAIGPAGEVTLSAPVPEPRNLYMAGANYADHAREMRGLGPEDEIVKPAGGPFMFLKPTSTVIGPGGKIVIAPGCERVDWEVELAVVIGRRAERVPVGEALDCVAGYTVANDVSVRARFVREDTAEPPMRFDWFQQKGWASSCPLGPWLVPARSLPDAQHRAMRLTLNGSVEQESRTSEMIFSIAEQIAFVSSVVPLLPGDVICTGTCAGVGSSKGRFLAPGDVVVAEIEGIGRLQNTVVAG